MSSLVRADPVLGRHLFAAEANGPVRRWQRGAALHAAIRDGVAVLAPFLRFVDWCIVLGHVDEYGQVEDDEVMILAPDQSWPDSGTIVAAGAATRAIRVAVAAEASLAHTATFVCDAGFAREAAVSPAAPLDGADAVWIEGDALLMETRLDARIDGLAYLELQLGTSLHDIADPRDPAHRVAGAALAAWRQANQRVLAALERALAGAGFERA